MTPRASRRSSRASRSACCSSTPRWNWTSWPALTNPFYLVDVVGFALLLWGALASLRARPNVAPGVLCAGYAWSAANGWRALALRIETLELMSTSRSSGCSSSERW